MALKNTTNLYVEDGVFLMFSKSYNYIQKEVKKKRHKRFSVSKLFYSLNRIAIAIFLFIRILINLCT